MLKSIIILLATVISLEIAWAVFFPDWQFISYQLRVGKVMLDPIIVAVFITSIIAYKLKSNQILFTLGLPLLLIAGGISYIALKPLDSTSHPKDIAIIKNHEDGQKTTLRQCYNYKRNNWHTDTLLVKDVLIFRRDITSKS